MTDSEKLRKDMSFGKPTASERIIGELKAQLSSKSQECERLKAELSEKGRECEALRLVMKDDKRVTENEVNDLQAEIDRVCRLHAEERKRCEDLEAERVEMIKHIDFTTSCILPQLKSHHTQPYAEECVQFFKKGKEILSKNGINLSQ